MTTNHCPVQGMAGCAQAGVVQQLLQQLQSLMKQVPVWLTLAGLLAAQTVNATVFVSNLGNDLSTSWVLGDGTTLMTSPADSPVANSFTTGPGGPFWTLNSVTFNFGRNGSPSGGISAYLAADSGGSPGSLLANLTGPSPTGLAEELTFTPDISYNLAPNTTYWLVAKAPYAGLDNYVWNSTSDTSETSPAGWTIGNAAYSSDIDGNWSVLADGIPTLFAVDATVVPEPHEYALAAGLGLAGFAFWRRHRARARA